MIGFLFYLLLFLLVCALVWKIASLPSVGLPPEFRSVLLLVLLIAFVLACLYQFDVIGGGVNRGPVIIAR